MGSKTATCFTTPTQQSGTSKNHYKTWSSLSKIKSGVEGAATCAVQSKSATYHTPSPVTCNDFFKSATGRTSINNDVDISKVTVSYYQKKSVSNGKSPGIGKPEIILYYGSTKLATKTGSAPGTTGATYTVSFSGLNLTPAKINNSNFKVVIKYPKNTNTVSGTLSLYWVRVTCEYTVPSYELSIIPSDSIIRKDTLFTLGFKIKNKNKTSYNPLPSITLPNELEFMGKSRGDGDIKVNGSTINWDPKLSKTKLESTVYIMFKSSVAQDISIGFSCETISLNKITKSLKLNVNNKVLNLTISDVESNIKSDESVIFNLDVSTSEYYINTEEILISSNGNLSIPTFSVDGSLISLDCGPNAKLDLYNFNSDNVISSGMEVKAYPIDGNIYSCKVQLDKIPDNADKYYRLFINGETIVGKTINDSSDENYCAIIFQWSKNEDYIQGDYAYINEVSITEEQDIWVNYRWKPQPNSDSLKTILHADFPVALPSGHNGGEANIKINYNNTDYNYEYNIYPSFITGTYYDYVQLDDEECKRLGDGIVYEASAYMKVKEPDADATICLHQDYFVSDDSFESDNLNYISSNIQNGRYSIRVACENSLLYGKEFVVYDTQGKEISRDVCDNNGELSFSWNVPTQQYTIDDYAHITYDSFYENGIPDYLFNHRLGIYNDDPSLVFIDGTGHDSDWENYGFTFEESDNLTDLLRIPRCFANIFDGIYENIEFLGEVDYDDVSHYGSINYKLKTPRPNTEFLVFYNEIGDEPVRRVISDSEGVIIVNSNGNPNYNPIIIDFDNPLYTHINDRYINLHEFNENDTWVISFKHYPNIDDEEIYDDYTKKGVILGDKELLFSSLGVSFDNVCTVSLRYDGDCLYVFVDDEGFCIYEDFIPKSQYNFGFFSTGSNICFSNFKLQRIDSEVNIEDAFNNAIWSEQVDEHNIWKHISVDFVYDKNNPLILFFSGEPIELYPASVNLLHTNPCIQEEDEDNIYLANNGNYPSPFNFLISQEDTEFASAEGLTEQLIFYNYPFFENIGDSDTTAIQGITVSFDAPLQEDTTVLATLRLGDKVGTRSVNLSSENDEETQIILGGEYDRWGLKYTDFNDVDTIELLIQHLGSNAIHIHKVEVTIHYENINPVKVDCFVGDVDDESPLEDVKYYGMFLTDVEIPGGTDTDTQYLQVSGTDTNNAYRMNLDKKEITLKFRIPSCNLTESSQKLKRIAKLFMNRRDDLNQPLPKRIEFSHYPNEYWEYVMEKSIDAAVKLTDYECSLTLTVPSGTSYSKELRSTNLVGSNDSLVKVSPIIKLTELSNNIDLSNNSDHWSINLPDSLNVSSDDFLEINCLTRKVYLHKYLEDENYEVLTGVEQYCDYGNDWFLLDGEYNFSCTGATVNSISFRERW